MYSKITSASGCNIKKTWFIVTIRLHLKIECERYTFLIYVQFLLYIVNRSFEFISAFETVQIYFRVGQPNLNQLLVYPPKKVNIFAENDKVYSLDT